MAKTGTKSGCCRVSVTSVTKRNKRNLLRLDSKRNNVTSPPFRGDVCYACPGSVQNELGALPDLLGISSAAMELAKDFQLLRSEVLRYLDGYTGRGVRSEGLALARLRKTVDR